MFANLLMPLDAVQGIGSRRTALLKESGIETAADLLLTVPYRYVDRSGETPVADLAADEEATVVGLVAATAVIPRGRRRLQMTVDDGTGKLTCTWFAGYRYLAKAFSKGDLVAVGGKIGMYRGKPQMLHPEVEVLAEAAQGLDLGDELAESDSRIHTGRIVPLYSTTQAMKAERFSSRVMRRILFQALRRFESEIVDPIPEGAADGLDLPSFKDAIMGIHFPETMDDVEHSRRRLAFGELFTLQVGKQLLRRLQPGEEATAFPVPEEGSAAWLPELPFTLTNAQVQARDAVWQDMSSTVPMRRLLQGDVGSGKTVVALAAMLAAAEQGAQAALMAPTEILAEQHAANLQTLVRPYGYPVFLVTSRLDATARKQAHRVIEAGEAKLVVGTHSLVQEAVQFRNLGLAVIDEEHRFGVKQREALPAKGGVPHVLAMTATPIPRSLALTAYGDMEVAVIDEMPAGRPEVTTGWRPASQRDRAFAFLRDDVKKGRQAFIVYPAIDESEAELRSATEGYEALGKGILADLKLGLLHGRMKSEERDQVDGAFRRGEIDVLVTTTVVEVGVDVPNATVMLVEHAERFGLAQLHQLRGRVGRGTEPSFCILIADPKERLTPEAQARLETMVRTRDGFEIAEMDLKIRGPGHLFGTRQSGFPEFRYADLAKDVDLAAEARDRARETVEADPGLKSPRHESLSNELRVAIARGAFPGLG